MGRSALSASKHRYTQALKCDHRAEKGYCDDQHCNTTELCRIALVQVSAADTYTCAIRLCGVHNTHRLLG